MKENKDDQILQHIIKYCHQIETTVAYYDVDKDEFENNFVMQNALSTPIMQIGELVKKLSDNFRKENIHIPWRSIAGMRDRLIHDYLEMDTDIAWEVIATDIPQLSKNCSKILAERGLAAPEPEAIKTHKTITKY